MDNTKQSAAETLKAASKRLVQTAAEATGLISSN